MQAYDIRSNMNHYCLEKCRLCLKSLDDSYGHSEITKDISNEILKLFPREVIKSN